MRGSLGGRALAPAIPFDIAVEVASVMAVGLAVMEVASVDVSFWIADIPCFAKNPCFANISCAAPANAV